MTSITYGSHVIEVESLPAKNLLAMITRGVSHFLGNEVSAKVGTELQRQAAAELKNRGIEKPTDVEVKNFVAEFWPNTSDHYAKVKAQLTADAYQRLTNGEVGAAVRGPSVTPMEKAIRAEAVARAKSRLAAQGLKQPKGDQTVSIGGVAKTFDQIVEGIISRELDEDRVIKGVKYEAIAKVAKRVVKESEDRAKKAKAIAESEDEGEDAGL